MPPEMVLPTSEPLEGAVWPVWVELEEDISEVLLGVCDVILLGLGCSLGI